MEQSDFQSLDKFDINYLSNSCIRVAKVREINITTGEIVVEYTGSHEEEWPTTVLAGSVLGFNSSTAQRQLQDIVEYDGGNKTLFVKDTSGATSSVSMAEHYDVSRALILRHHMRVMVYKNNFVDSGGKKQSEYFILSPTDTDMPETVGLLDGLLVQPATRISLNPTAVSTNGRYGYFGLQYDYSGDFVNKSVVPVSFIEEVTSGSQSGLSYSRGKKSTLSRNTYEPWTNFSTLRYPRNFYIIYDNGEDLVAFPFMCVARATESVPAESYFEPRSNYGSRTRWSSLIQGKYYSASLVMDGTFTFTKQEPCEIGYSTQNTIMTMMEVIYDASLLFYTNPPYFLFNPPWIDSDGTGHFRFKFVKSWYMPFVGGDAETDCLLTAYFGRWRTETVDVFDSNYDNNDEMPYSLSFTQTKSTLDYTMTFSWESIYEYSSGYSGVEKFACFSVSREIECTDDCILSGHCESQSAPSSCFSSYSAFVNSASGVEKKGTDTSATVVSADGFVLSFSCRTESSSMAYQDSTYTNAKSAEVVDAHCALSEGHCYCVTHLNGITNAINESTTRLEIVELRETVFKLNGSTLFTNKQEDSKYVSRTNTITSVYGDYERYEDSEAYVTKTSSLGIEKGALHYFDANKKVIIYSVSEPCATDTTSDGYFCHTDFIDSDNDYCSPYPYEVDVSLKPLLVQSKESFLVSLVLRVGANSIVIDADYEKGQIAGDFVPFACVVAENESVEYNAPQFNTIGGTGFISLSFPSLHVCSRVLCVKSNHDASLIYICYLNDSGVRRKFYRKYQGDLVEVSMSHIAHILDMGTYNLTL